MRVPIPMVYPMCFMRQHRVQLCVLTSSPPAGNMRPFETSEWGWKAPTSLTLEGLVLRTSKPNRQLGQGISDHKSILGLEAVLCGLALPLC